MKNKLVVIFSVALIFISAICLGIVFSSNSKTKIEIVNPVSQTTLNIQTQIGKKYKDINTESFNNNTYSFCNFYYDENLKNVIDPQSAITSNTKIYVGLSKRITNKNQIDQNEKLVGIKFVGSLDQETINILCNYKYLDLSESINVPVFLANNSIVEKIIFPENCQIENLNNYANLKEIYLKNVSLIKNSFNNCNNLEIINSIDSTVIENSFNNCAKLKDIKLSRNIYSLTDCFIKTKLTNIYSENNKYKVIRNALYEVFDDEKYLIKAINNTQNLSVDSSTSKILEYAFYNTQIKNVTINAKVAEIGKYCFFDSDIENIDFSRNSAPITIGESAFFRCDKLSSVKFSQYTFNIHKNAFRQTALKTIDLSESLILQNCGEYCFAENTYLEKIKFPTQQISLKEYACYFDYNLTTIENLNVQNLSKSVFRNCENLEDINLISNLNTVEEYAFYGCYSLENTTFAKNATTVKTNSFCRSGIAFANFDNLSQVQEYAFADCENLKSFSSATVIASIDFSAFDNCNNIETINFTSADYYLSYPAIYSADNKNLKYYLPTASNTTFDIPATVETINNKSLSFAKNLESITTSSDKFYCENGVLYELLPTTKKLICYPQAKDNVLFELPAGVEQIASYAFAYNKNLLGLYLEQDLNKIEKAALWQISKLSTLKTNLLGQNYTDTQNGFLGHIFGAQIYEDSFRFVPASLRDIYVGKQTNFSDGVFYNCQNLTQIALEKSSSITDYMFFCCKSLVNLEIKDTIQSVGKYAFYGCQNLNKLIWGYYQNVQVLENALKNTPNSNVTVTLNNSLEVDPESFKEYKNKFEKGSWIWVKK